MPAGNCEGAHREPERRVAERRRIGILYHKFRGCRLLAARQYPERRRSCRPRFQARWQQSAPAIGSSVGTVRNCVAQPFPSAARSRRPACIRLQRTLVASPPSLKPAARPSVNAFRSRVDSTIIRSSASPRVPSNPAFQLPGLTSWPSLPIAPPASQIL